MGSKHDLRQVKENVYWRSIYSLSVLNMWSQHDSHQVKVFVYWLLTCSLSLLNIDSKSLRQLQAFVYCRSTYSLSVLNMISKHDWRQLNKFIYWRSTCGLLNLYKATKNYSLQQNKFVNWPICSEYGLQTWLEKTQKIGVLALDLGLISRECFRNLPCVQGWNSCFGALLAAYLCWICVPNMTSSTENNPELALDLRPNSDECTLETLNAPTEVIHVQALEMQCNQWLIWSRDNNGTKRGIRVLVLEIQPLRSHNGLET